MMSRSSSYWLGVAVALVAASSAQAHFIFLLPAEEAGAAPSETRTVHVYFGEDASPDDPDLLRRLTDLQAWQVTPGAEPRALATQSTPEGLQLKLVENGGGSLVVLADDYGVISRGDAKFHLMYYAKTGPEAGDEAWGNVDTAGLLKLDVAPRFTGEQVELTVRFGGKPVAGAQVVAAGPDLDVEAVTNEAGQVAFVVKRPGTISIRARHIEPASGGASLETRHYSTVAFRTRGAARGDQKLSPLETPVTSFGGAVLDGAVYIYGGHSGSAHHYSHAEQGDRLLRLSLSGEAGWEPLAKGPALQGLALVAYGGKLYRIGGFTAKNADGEEHDLWSQDSVACYDPATKVWTDLSPLPEPRSSFDAAVLGDAIYVIGGWQLRGEEDSIWHATAWKLDLTEAQPKWTEIPTPPFQRRALAVAAHEGKLYVIGGMQQEGGPTRRVDIFDPATGTWSRGPDIPGEKAIAGFGASAFALDGRLYVSTSEGKLHRLAREGRSWEVARELPTGRFFHRMLPTDDHRLVMVGGANMGTGKFAEVELLSVPSAP